MLLVDHLKQVYTATYGHQRDLSDVAVGQMVNIELNKPRTLTRLIADNLRYAPAWGPPMRMASAS